MKILHTVEFYYPSVGGAQEVVRHLSERMATAGHEVTVATTKLANRTGTTHNGVKIVEFAVSGNSVNGIKGEKKKYQDFLKNSQFDVIMNYAAQEWTADAFFEVMDAVKGVKVFVPCGYSALYDESYADYFKKLPVILKKYDATVYLSNTYRDISFGQDHGLTNMHVIPNAADETEFSNVLSHEERSRLKNQYGVGGLVLMTIGNYTGEKGHSELLRVFRQLPVSKATLISAGTTTPGVGCFDMFEQAAHNINQSRKLLGKRVVMVDGADRPLVRSLLQCADIFAFFSNIECSPLVLFELTAAGVPFVASNAGNNAEIAEWTGGGVIVKSHPRPNGRVEIDARDALWRTTRLAHNNREKRQAMGQQGRRAWQQHYTWQKVTNQYLDLYKQLLRKTAK